jgi:hypothetical protein
MLEACDVLCLKALRALLYFEFHGLTFIEGLVTAHLNGGVKYEHVFPDLVLDEPVALRRIKPLYCSFLVPSLLNLDIDWGLKPPGAFLEVTSPRTGLHWN